MVATSPFLADMEGGADGENPGLPKLEAGALGTAWEELRLLRRRVASEDEPHMSRWVNRKAVGVPSVKAMVLNNEALVCMAKLWCPTQDYPKMMPIDVVRPEVCTTKHFSVFSVIVFVLQTCFVRKENLYSLYSPEIIGIQPGRWCVSENCVAKSRMTKRWYKWMPAD